MTRPENPGNLPGMLPAAVADRVSAAWERVGDAIAETDHTPEKLAAAADRCREMAEAYREVRRHLPPSSVLMKLCLNAENYQADSARFWAGQAEAAAAEVAR